MDANVSNESVNLKLTEPAMPPSNEEKLTNCRKIFCDNILSLFESRQDLRITNLIWKGIYCDFLFVKDKIMKNGTVPMFVLMIIHADDDNSRTRVPHSNKPWQSLCGSALPMLELLKELENEYIPHNWRILRKSCIKIAADNYCDAVYEIYDLEN